ncbi:sulfite exporter TauE/SafE family protein [Desulforamulus aquiferis]|uniref:Probable membrane transporter protein n=1 Tax=Desulforamulus aquiferis TaxID=1397668 RepID=A0AAW7ZEL3_9FIRM|nr:sulfite exporter TauE/SafE family protein [Desulforamulus aquiferis]MDO7787720.1 sulfite exporter TauE/SafE family protein [Desulforamulus aquiferis]RYD03708.1 hypothetical protein N752_18340 [Desulforamulus aquiferis]
MYEWIFAAIIVFIASALQAITGFGFAIMATPFLLLVFNSRDCIQMSIFLSLFIALVLTPRIKKDIDYKLLKRLIWGGFVGVPIGLLFFAYVSLSTLKITVSIAILIVTCFLLFRCYNSYRTQKMEVPDLETEEQEAKTEAEVFKYQEKRNEVMVGLSSGVMTTSIGMPGVPLALYFNAKNERKEVVRSTTLAFFIFVYTVSIIAQLLTVKIGLEVLIASLILTPAAALGIVIGNVLFGKINQQVFQLIANGILLYTGFYMLINTF